MLYDFFNNFSVYFSFDSDHRSSSPVGCYSPTANRLLPWPPSASQNMTNSNADANSALNNGNPNSMSMVNGNRKFQHLGLICVVCGDTSSGKCYFKFILSFYQSISFELKRKLLSLESSNRGFFSPLLLSSQVNTMEFWHAMVVLDFLNVVYDGN